MMALFKTLVSARQRERELKGWRREKKMKLIERITKKITKIVI